MEPFLAFTMSTFEPLKNGLQRLLGDANPVVAHLKATPSLRRSSFADLDVTRWLVRVGVFDGIREQIDK